jgi:hypothetical protein
LRGPFGAGRTIRGLSLCGRSGRGAGFAAHTGVAEPLVLKEPVWTVPGGHFCAAAFAPAEPNANSAAVIMSAVARIFM